MIFYIKKHIVRSHTVLSMQLQRPMSKINENTNFVIQASLEDRHCFFVRILLVFISVRLIPVTCVCTCVCLLVDSSVQNSCPATSPPKGGELSRGANSRLSWPAGIKFRVRFAGSATGQEADAGSMADSEELAGNGVATPGSPIPPARS